MMFRPFSVVLAAGAAMTLAAPVDRVLLSKRIVPTETCTKRASGQLTGAGGQKFAISDDGTSVVYAASGSDGLEVEFQACDPNFNKYPNSGDGPYAGHIFVPKVNKCLHVPSYNPNTTYGLLLEDCYYSGDSGQFAFNFLQKGSDYYWSGATMADGSLIQGDDTGCTDGLYGYQGAEGGAAVESGNTTVACASSSNVQAFKIE